LVATAFTKTVPVQVRVIGNGEAFSTVSIKSQVNAELMEVHFREGQFVKKDDLLFTVDRRPFDAALHQAEATLARDQAQEALAEIQSRRYVKLYEDGVASNEQAEQMRANDDALKAAVLAGRRRIFQAAASIVFHLFAH
jgi:membrane fusion protein, multidrug efflux system